MNRRKLVLASNNAGKVREFNELLDPLSIEVVPQGLLGIPACEEPHPTFVENALTKARHAAKLSGMAALADDSGICVKALDGAPGIYSARFALSNQKKSPTDTDNIQLLLKKMVGIEDRAAHFCATIVFIEHANDPEPLIASAQWHGQILHEPQGDGGFGYDPIFYVPTLQKTVAQLSSIEKNQYSHRAQALAQLYSALVQKFS